eukprot:NODE_12830_length_1201_cov_4.851024.p1 GENE.NODE_12830_length_1201_cov_4.851024~~NODE_12830_length_1201_cov_4.851024.p1  ORF type:complete len:323 (-),score=111.42 NODE_12830_length_1201_cov_4.851024:233-1129(-)
MGGSFDSIPDIMLTLVQFVTLDSVAGIYGPLIRHQPALVLFFTPLIMLVSIALMNLVTAVLVEGSMELVNTTQEEAKYQRHRELLRLDPIFRNFFRTVDSDQNGTVCLIEMEHIPKDAVPPELLAKIELDTLIELFEVLDADSSGLITEEEFVESLSNLCIADNKVSPETMMLLKLARQTRGESRQLQNHLHKLDQDLGELTTCVKAMALSQRMERLSGSQPDASGQAATVKVETVEAQVAECGNAATSAPRAIADRDEAGQPTPFVIAAQARDRDSDDKCSLFPSMDIQRRAPFSTL